jgi:hypothetical protein
MRLQLNKLQRLKAKRKSKKTKGGCKKLKLGATAPIFLCCLSAMMLSEALS